MHLKEIFSLCQFFGVLSLPQIWMTFTKDAPLDHHGGGDIVASI
jgi:hypothetical protein